VTGRQPAAGAVAPTAKNKWLTASVATVISQIFSEAERRDPDHPAHLFVDGSGSTRLPTYRAT